MSPSTWPAVGLPFAVVGLAAMAIALIMQNRESADRVRRVGERLVVAGICLMVLGLTVAIVIGGVAW